MYTTTFFDGPITTAVRHKYDVGDMILHNIDGFVSENVVVEITPKGLYRYAAAGRWDRIESVDASDRHTLAPLDEDQLIEAGDLVSRGARLVFTVSHIDGDGTAHLVDGCWPDTGMLSSVSRKTAVYPGEPLTLIEKADAYNDEEELEMTVDEVIETLSAMADVLTALSDASNILRRYGR